LQLALELQHSSLHFSSKGGNNVGGFFLFKDVSLDCKRWHHQLGKNYRTGQLSTAAQFKSIFCFYVSTFSALNKFISKLPSSKLRLPFSDCSVSS
jgi:hypothetical protein